MLVKEQLISELDFLSTPELLRIYDIVSSMKMIKDTKKTSKTRSQHYLKVRNALSSIRTPLSDFVISERDDRV